MILWPENKALLQRGSPFSCPKCKEFAHLPKTKTALVSSAHPPCLISVNKSKEWKKVFYTSGLHASVQICFFPSSGYIRQGDLTVTVSLLLSERSAIAGEGKGGKGLATFHHLFAHFQDTETWWFSLLAQKNLFGLVVMAQLKPSCSHSSSIQIVFNNLNGGDFLIFLSGSTTTIVPAGKSCSQRCWNLLWTIDENFFSF